MIEWRAVSRQAHADLGYRPREGYRHTEGQMVSAVLLTELPALLPHYVLGFVPGAEGVVPVALLGVEKDQNLYLHQDGCWLGKYAPALMRAFPFALADGDNGNKVLAVAAEQISEGGEPFFDGDELSASVQEVLDFITRCEHAREATLNAANALSERGILTDWQLRVTVGEERKQVNGLKRVDERALNQLDAEAYASLQGAPMQLAYAQLYSMAQVDQLSQRFELKQKSSGSINTEVDLERLFGDEDDDLTFGS